MRLKKISYFAILLLLLCFLGGIVSHSSAATAGTLKWSFPAGDWVESSPAIGSDGTVYVGSNDYKLYAINPNGTLKWSFPTGNLVASSPAIGSDGTVYVGSWDYNLYAINPNGTLKWSFPTGDVVWSSPAIGSDGTVYIGSYDHMLYAINPNGTLKWSFPTGDVIWSSPAIGSDGTVYVGSWDYNLYAINPDGTLKWSFPTGAQLLSSPAIGSDGTVYVGSDNHMLYAINPSGTLKWSFPTGDVVWSSPAIGSDGTVYVGSNDYKLYAINDNGTLKWNFTTGNLVASSPAIGSDGTVYVGSNDYKLYAINDNGTLKWNFTTGNLVASSPAIGSDGTVYVGSKDGKLYAVNGDTGLANTPWPKFGRDVRNTGTNQCNYAEYCTFPNFSILGQYIGSEYVYQMDFFNGVPSYLNSKSDGSTTGSYYQCTEYAARYLHGMFGTDYTDSKNINDSNTQGFRDYNFHPDYSGNPPAPAVDKGGSTISLARVITPQAGDVAIFTFGHTAIVKSVSGTTATLIEQNYISSGQYAVNRTVSTSTAGLYFYRFTAAVVEGTNPSYTSIQAAYDSATTNGQSVLTQALVFTEDPDFARDISISLRGGYDYDFISHLGWTIINGKLTISAGTVTIENICIR